MAPDHLLQSTQSTVSETPDVRKDNLTTEVHPLGLLGQSDSVLPTVTASRYGVSGHGVFAT